MSEGLFATFWSGPLNALVAACLASFPARGARLRLYAYAPYPEAPSGVEIADAREICPDAGLIGRYLYKGRPSLATFADRFRYELLARVDCCWIDADMFALAPLGVPDAAIVLGFQPETAGEALINNAVLKLPPGHPVLNALLARARAAEGVDLSWGALGPFLLHELASAEGLAPDAAPARTFYPVAPEDFWMLFDPASREAVEAACAGAALVHLWSELLRRVGYDFDAAPPTGAYLHDRLAQTGARFKRTATTAEIGAMRDKWLASAPKAHAGAAK